jgi:hypothetical protein
VAEIDVALAVKAILELGSPPHVGILLAINLSFGDFLRSNTFAALKDLAADRD